MNEQEFQYRKRSIRQAQQIGRIWEKDWMPLNDAPPRLKSGWKCPNCGQANAPWVERCLCV